MKPVLLYIRNFAFAMLLSAVVVFAWLMTQ